MADVFRISGSEDWQGKVRLDVYRFRRVRLCRDKTVSREWLAKLQNAVSRVRAGEPADPERLAGIDARLLEQLGLTPRMVESRRKTWARHVDDYASELKTGGRNVVYVRKAEACLKMVGTECGCATVADAERDAFRAMLDRKRIGGAGVRTVRNIRDCVRGFLRWAVKMKRADRSALDVFDIDLADPRTDRKLIRRAMSDAEVSALLTTVAGSEREIIYRVALGTGLRWRECRDLQWRDVRLDVRPCLALRPEATKSKRADTIPMQADLGRRLGAMRRSRPFARPTDAVFPRMPDWKRWKADIEAAGIAYRDGENRICGFHSLRVTLGTRLERLGVPVKARMAIIRHTDPLVSYGTYSDLALLDIHGIADRLPIDDAAEVAAVRRTGTDDRPERPDQLQDQSRCAAVQFRSSRRREDAPRDDAKSLELTGIPACFSS